MCVRDTVAKAPSAEGLQDLSRFSPTDLRSDGQRAIYDWYLGQDAGGGIPKRRNFEPMDFPTFLPYLVLVDVEEAPRRYRVRLVGTKLVDARGETAPATIMTKSKVSTWRSKELRELSKAVKRGSKPICP